jgi:hypothetical protein
MEAIWPAPTGVTWEVGGLHQSKNHTLYSLWFCSLGQSHRSPPDPGSAAQDLLRSALQALAQQSTAPPPCIDLGLHVGKEGTITAQAAARIYRTWLKRWHIQERFPQTDRSIVDLWLARKLLAMHISPTQVEAIIRLGSPHFPRRHGDPVDYLRRTLARAALPVPTPRTVADGIAPSRM